jgi:hypothetical protein
MKNEIEAQTEKQAKKNPTGPFFAPPYISEKINIRDNK